MAAVVVPHCTGMTNCPNTIQCLGSDNIMSLCIKSFATEGVHDKVRDKVHDKVHDWYQDLGTKILGEPVLHDGGTALLQNLDRYPL